MAEVQSGVIASEVETGTSSPTGERDSRDSEWSSITVPNGWAINKDKTEVSVISERGSEHDYWVEYGDDVEIIAGTDVWLPRTIRVKTHARSHGGPFGASGAMKISVKFYYVKYA